MMKKVLAFVFLFSMVSSPILAEELGFKPFHPTDADALLIGGNGPFNPGADHSEAQVEVKPFHPTDALLIGGNGPFNPGAEHQEEK